MLCYPCERIFSEQSSSQPFICNNTLHTTLHTRHIKKSSQEIQSRNQRASCLRFTSLGCYNALHCWLSRQHVLGTGFVVTDILTVLSSVHYRNEEGGEPRKVTSDEGNHFLLILLDISSSSSSKTSRPWSTWMQACQIRKGQYFLHNAWREAPNRWRCHYEGIVFR